MTVPLTPRELRIIADHVERYTKARVMNAKIGIDTTPDLVVVDFPNRFTGTLIWTPGRQGNNSAERTALEKHARHRDSYTLDLATLEVTGGPRAPRIEVRMPGVNADVVEHMARVLTGGQGRNIS